MQLERRKRVPENYEEFVQRIARHTSEQSLNKISSTIEKLAKRIREIHEKKWFKIKPATNVMNLKAEKYSSRYGFRVF
ncbi:MAG: hypothetical protein R3D86_09675 [Emcibacteraceae bacterium]